MKRGVFTPNVAENLGIVREIGNFIHLNESLGTGTIVEISTKEAKWVLDILERLFLETYVSDHEREEMPVLVGPAGVGLPLVPDGAADGGSDDRVEHAVVEVRGAVIASDGASGGARLSGRSLLC